MTFTYDFEEERFIQKLLAQIQTMGEANKRT